MLTSNVQGLVAGEHYPQSGEASHPPSHQGGGLGPHLRKDEPVIAGTVGQSIQHGFFTLSISVEAQDSLPFVSMTDGLAGGKGREATQEYTGGDRSSYQAQDACTSFEV